MNVYSSTIHTSKKLETTQIPIKQSMDRLQCICNRSSIKSDVSIQWNVIKCGISTQWMLLSKKKDRFDACNNSVMKSQKPGR